MPRASILKNESNGCFGMTGYNLRSCDPYITHFTQPDTIIPQSQGTQAWDRYAYANNNPISYNDPSGHCISSDNGVWANLSCVISIVSATVSYAVNNPDKLIKGKMVNLSIVIPKGMGSDAIDLVTYPVRFKDVRIIGRAGDDLVMPTFVIGGIVTLAPEQIEDFQSGASFSEHLADALIDGVGFGASEFIGDIAFIASGENPLAMLIVDGLVGYGYDWLTDDYRDEFQSLLEASQLKHPAPPSPAVPAPHPPTRKAPGTPAPSGTPIPF